MYTIKATNNLEEVHSSAKYWYYSGRIDYLGNEWTQSIDYVVYYPTRLIARIEFHRVIQYFQQKLKEGSHNIKHFSYYIMKGIPPKEIEIASYNF